jgi:CRP/FNR family transcriptional regulator, cyclic AMP receptor protein
MQQTRIEALQHMPIFGGIRADVLEFLLDASGMVSVRQGQYFFHENDKAESMFVLEAGAVSVLKLWGGQECVLRRLGQGDCFGEMALMDLYPRSASILAVEHCTAIEMSTASFYKIYEKDLEQFALIQMNIGREVSRRLRVADEHLFRARMGAPYVAPDGTFPST